LKQEKRIEELEGENLLLSSSRRELHVEVKELHVEVRRLREASLRMRERNLQLSHELYVKKNREQQLLLEKSQKEEEEAEQEQMAEDSTEMSLEIMTLPSTSSDLKCPLPAASQLEDEGDGGGALGTETAGEVKQLVEQMATKYNQFK
jgi:hypothetical protein